MGEFPAPLTPMNIQAVPVNIFPIIRPARKLSLTNPFFSGGIRRLRLESENPFGTRNLYGNQLKTENSAEFNKSIAGAGIILAVLLITLHKIFRRAPRAGNFSVKSLFPLSTFCSGRV